MSFLGRIYTASRNNWQILLLAFLILVATYFLFVPGATIGDDGTLADEGERGLTNLQYGIDLGGGARIRAPVYGFTAEGAFFESGDDTAEVSGTIAELLDIDEADVSSTFNADDDDTIEMFDPDISESAFAEALDEAGFSDYTIREGVTAETRASIVDVLNNRIDAAGFAGGTVRSETTATGEHFIVVESPGRDLQELEDVIADRGVVQVLAHYPDDGNYTEEVLLYDDQIADIGTVSYNEERQAYEVPITVAEHHLDEFIGIMQAGGFDEPTGWQTCEYPVLDPGEERPQERPDGGWGHCLLIESDGEILDGYGVNPGLGEMFQGPDPQFALERVFVISVSDASEAERSRINLEEGALAAQLNVDDASTMFMSPVLAEQFLRNSLLTGLLAIFAVVTMVFLRYGDPRVAAPMSVTALSELYILLGFAAAVGLSLDLAHMAGFIAVVGTGVDDLIIIADEVMGDSDVRSRRVFDSRFRKAFWVIGAAAATTIIAMSPLAIMTLGDLRGFAIVTILGVLIGVSITRPAYGNILRMIKTDK